MISTLPAVTYEAGRAYRHICHHPQSRRKDKRIANRRYRRALNRATRRIQLNPEKFWDEGFNAPSWTDWDVW